MFLLSLVVGWAGFAGQKAGTFSAVRLVFGRDRTIMTPASARLERTRRGDAARSKETWRRLSLGTNRISSFGVWRIGARRIAPRTNRKGETRWHHMRSGMRGAN